MRPSDALKLHRVAMRAITMRHRVRNPRLFGSVVHGVDTEGSDIDLLVEPTAETTLLDIGAIRYELRQLLGMRVDVLTPNALPEKFRERVLAEALPL